MKNMKIGTAMWVCLLLSFFFGTSAKAESITSPDGQLKLNFSVNMQGEPVYELSYKGKEVIKPSKLGLELKNDPGLMNGFTLADIKTSAFDETWEPVWGEVKSIRNHYNEMAVTLNQKAQDRNLIICFRLYNDGLGFRYEFPQQKNLNYFVIKEEHSQFAMAGDHTAFWIPGDYDTQEYDYTESKLSEIRGLLQGAITPNASQTPFSPTGVQTSLQMKTADGLYINLHEAALVDYSCMHLNLDDQNLIFESWLTPDAKGDKGYMQTPCRSPWRTVIVSDDARDILASKLTLNLNEPCIYEDVSWIKPGQVSWEWWNDASPYGPDVDFVSGYNLDTYKYYIDFASKFGIPYIIMDEGWAKSTRDPYTPNPKVDLHELIRYGKEKNVGIVLWLTWLTVENNFDLFKTFNEWGVKGLKIDFMDRSDQWMVNYYERVAREAAKHHLFVDFHGSFKPAGLEYKYPNVLSYEGVRGMEQMGGCYPDNSLYLPFMRNAVGPMDYTPGAMISMQPNVYRSERPNAASIGTRAYQLALFVVFESGLQMLADNPTLYYRNEDCTRFITQVPVTWDETVALEAKAGEYVIVAKRKGDKWFIGGMTNNGEKEREFTIKLDFLNKDRSYQMTSFEDGINAGRQAMDYRCKSSQVKAGEQLTIKMVRNGGFAAVIE